MVALPKNVGALAAARRMDGGLVRGLDTTAWMTVEYAKANGATAMKLTGGPQ